MKKSGIFLFIAITHTSSFFGLVLYLGGFESISSSFSAINDLTLFLLGLLSLYNLKFRYFKVQYLITVFLLVALLLFSLLVLSQAEFYYRIFAFRKLVTLILAFFVGYNLFRSGFSFKMYLQWHYLIFIPVAVFGMIEYLLPTTLWDEVLELPKYWKFKGELFATYSVEGSGKFYSYDLYPLIGQKTRRIVSFYTETKPLASYCIFLFPFAYFCKEVPWRKLILVLLLMVGVLTYSKGFLLVVLMCLFSKRVHLRPWYIYLVFFLFLFMGAIVHKLGIGIGPLSHVEGLYTGILIPATGNILGVGLGATGNYISPLAESLGGGESGLGALAGQIGIGAVLFFIVVYRLMKACYDRYEYTLSSYHYASFVCLFGWMINFFYAEASLGFRGNIFVFLSAGILLSIRADNKSLETSTMKTTHDH